MNKYSKKIIGLKTFSISFFFTVIILIGYFGGLIEDDEGITLFTFNAGSILILLGVILGVILFSFVYSLLFYKTHYYSFSQNEITLKTGVIFKKTCVLPYEKINNIKISRTLFDMMFNLSCLKIDSGSSVQGVTEITIYDLPEKIKEYNDSLRQKIGLNPQEEITSDYKYTFKNNIGYSLVRYGFLAGFVFVIYVIGMFLLDTISGEESTGDLPFVIIFSLIAFLAICVIIPVVNRIRLYKFSVTKQNNIINLSYGLFEQKKITISMDRIRAIKICQSLFQRIFGTVTVKLEVIGFEADTNKQYEKSVLLPYVKKSELGSYFNYFFEGWDLSETKVITPDSNAFLHYLTIPLVIFNFYVLLPVYVVFILAELYVLVPIVCVTVNLLIYVISRLTLDIQKIAYNNKYIIITNGAFDKNITIINKKDITAISRLTTPARSKAGLASYGINYYSQGGEMLKVSVAKDDEFENFVDTIRIKKEG